MTTEVRCAIGARRCETHRDPRWVLGVGFGGFAEREWAGFAGRVFDYLVATFSKVEDGDQVGFAAPRTAIQSATDIRLGPRH